MGKHLLFAGLMLCFSWAFAQNEESKTDTANYPYWIEMMQDENANFFATQRAFNVYWENREVTRGSGYKPFKRWENFMKYRVDEKGKRPAADKNFNAFVKITEEQNTKSPSGNWNLVGPIDLPNPESGQPNGLGRINVIEFHPTDPNVIYIGAPAGGFWKTLDGGENWLTTTDRMPSLGVSAIAVNPQDPNEIYIGTGDRDASDAPGLGVFKSNDAGNTWVRVNDGMGNITVNKLLIFPDTPNMLLAATDAGIYKTTNGGTDWSMVTSGTSKSMEFKPGNSDVVFAVKGGSLYRSTNAGTSWSRLSSGLSNWSRAVVGVTPANPEYVYVLATNPTSFKALYRSTNGGDSFSTMSTTPNIMDWSYNGSGTGGQAWYDLALTVDHKNPDVIFAGGINIFKSTDGGVTWRINAHWVGQGAPAVHADHHDLVVNPINKKVYTANDGGIYWTDNGGTTWNNITDGIAISQIYKIGQSRTVRDRVLAGNQDNGTSYFHDGDWSVIFGGDGMECLIDWLDERYLYKSIYYGAVYRSINNNNDIQVAGNGVGGINEQGEWVTPYTLSTSNTNVMYIGMNNVWKTSNIKSSNVSWSKITNSIASSARVTVIENAEANADVMYISRTDRSSFVSTNVNSASPTWTRINSLPTAYVTDFTSHYTDDNIAYATLSNNHVYRTYDKGIHWVKITGNLPYVSMNCVAIDKNSNEGLYVGTDIGVFYKDASMKDWIYFSDGFPAAAKVTEIEIYYDDENPENNILRAATYGRGLWETDLFTEKVSQENDARITVIENPNAVYEPSDSVEITFILRNIGSTNLTDVAIEFALDNGTPSNFNWNGDIATHNNASVSVPKFMANSGSHNYTIALKEANGTAINYTTDGAFSVNEGHAIQVNLTSDLTASETSYLIEDESGNLLYTSEEFNDDSLYSIVENYTLTAGCYRFIIQDPNGLGDGNYSVNNLSTNTELGNGGTFTTADTVAFCIEAFPTPIFSVTTNIVEYQTEVSITNNSITEGYSYYWNFGKGASPATSTEAAPPAIVYNTGGYKTVSLTISNNGSSATTSINKFLSVYDEVTINNQTPDLDLCPSQNIELIVNAQGFNANYQWYKDGASLYRETDSILLIENGQHYDAGNYYCKVSNEFYEVSGEEIAVSIKEVPELSITASPESICTGNEVSLLASGEGDFTWSHNLGTSAEVTDSPEQTTTYYAYLTNTDGCTTSKQITVEVAQMPNVVDQADHVLICEGKNSFLKINAEGGALSYQWKKDGEIIADGSNTLLLDNISLDDEGQYLCVVSNICGSSNSEEANVTVDPLPIAAFSHETEGTKVWFSNESEHGKTYDWDFGDGNTSTVINPDHVYTEGEYRPQLLVKNDCGSDTIMQQISVYIDDVNELSSKETFSVYPNPTNGPFNMLFNSDEFSGSIQLMITNMEGKVVSQSLYEKKGSEISIPVNTNELSKGLYQISITIGNRVLRSKVMVY